MPPFGFVCLFATLWFIVGWILRRKMRMTSKPPPASTTGNKLSQSSWGSALVNGVGCNNCLKIVWFENGILLRMMPIFGRGSLWLPGDQIEFGELEETQFLWIRSKKLLLSTADHEVWLAQGLAEFATAGQPKG